MGKKKKQALETNPSEQSLLFAPKQLRRAPSPASTEIPPGGSATPAHDDPSTFESPAFLEKVRGDAIELAKDCGLKPPFVVHGPDRVNYPRTGHGYVVTIKEDAGKQRLGTARFNSEGNPAYWSLDGIVTG